MISFRELLETDHVTVFDGAMGTMLYAKGVYINRSYDELNLTHPDLVRAVHEEYVRAGAEVIETNTFTRHRAQAPAVRARRQPARDQRRGRAARARGCRTGAAYVAGAVGPLGLRIEPYGPTSFDEAKELFKQQAEALLEGGVDLFVLETFSDISEMRQAIRAVRELSDLPIVAQMTIMLDGNTSFGTTPEVFTARLDEWGADVIGLNCGVGPATVLTAVEKMRARHDEEALGAAERRAAARRAGPTVLHVLARVHGEVREASHTGGRAASSAAAAARRPRTSSSSPTPCARSRRATRASRASSPAPSRVEENKPEERPRRAARRALELGRGGSRAASS